jgi:hypothetical protein
MSATTAVISIGFERLNTVLPSSPYFLSLEDSFVTVAIISLGAALAFMMVCAASSSVSVARSGGRVICLYVMTQPRDRCSRRHGQVVELDEIRTVIHCN